MEMGLWDMGDRPACGLLTAGLGSDFEPEEGRKIEHATPNAVEE
jgi:hypothetical protein